MGFWGFGESRDRRARARAKPEPSVAGLGRWVRRKARGEAIAGVSVCRDGRPCKGGLAGRFGLGKIFQVETLEPDTGSRRRKGRPRRRRSSRRRSTGTDLRVRVVWLAVSDFENFSKSRQERARARAKPEPSVAGLGRWVRRKALVEAIATAVSPRPCGRRLARGRRATGDGGAKIF